MKTTPSCVLAPESALELLPSIALFRPTSHVLMLRWRQVFVGEPATQSTNHEDGKRGRSDYDPISDPTHGTATKPTTVTDESPVQPLVVAHPQKTAAWGRGFVSKAVVIWCHLLPSAQLDAFVKITATLDATEQFVALLAVENQETVNPWSRAERPGVK